MNASDPSLANHPLTSLHLHIERYGVRELDSSWSAENRFVADSKLYLVTNGSGILSVDNRPIHLKPGFLYFFAGNTRQSFHTDSGLTLHWLHFRFALLNGIDPTLCFALYDRIGVSSVPTAKDDFLFIRKQHQFFLQNHHPGSLLAANARLMHLLSFLLRPASEKAYGKDFERLKKAVHYIDEHASTQILIKDLARRCGFERTYFSTIFRKTFGCSPQTFINQRRIRHIMPLLAQEHLLIEEVATRAGFDDAYYFSRFFKKHVGISPSEWRKKLKDPIP